MSRGLSQIQQKVMERIKDRGCLNIFKVAEIYHKTKAKKAGTDTTFIGSYWTEVRDIPNISSVYRMMKTLEDRGLVGTLLHKRPKEWYYIEWNENEDTIRLPYILNGAMPLLMVRNGHVKIRTKHTIITFNKKNNPY